MENGVRSGCIYKLKLSYLVIIWHLEDASIKCGVYVRGKLWNFFVVEFICGPHLYLPELGLLKLVIELLVGGFWEIAWGIGGPPGLVCGIRRFAPVWLCPCELLILQELFIYVLCILIGISKVFPNHIVGHSVGQGQRPRLVVVVALLGV